MEIEDFSFYCKKTPPIKNALNTVVAFVGFLIAFVVGL